MPGLTWTNTSSRSIPTDTPNRRHEWRSSPTRPPIFSTKSSGADIWSRPLPSQGSCCPDSKTWPRKSTSRTRLRWSVRARTTNSTASKGRTHHPSVKRAFTGHKNNNIIWAPPKHITMIRSQEMGIAFIPFQCCNPNSAFLEAPPAAWKTTLKTTSVLSSTGNFRNWISVGLPLKLLPILSEFQQVWLEVD